MVIRQLLDYFEKVSPVTHLECSFRRNCSTETGILRPFLDILGAVGNEQVAALLVLDLVAAFASRPLHSFGTNKAIVQFHRYSTLLTGFVSYWP